MENKPFEFRAISVQQPWGYGIKMNLKSIENSYVGFEKYGLAPNFRNYAEKGKIQVIDYPELICIDRFRAIQENLNFWSAAGLGGTDIVKLNKKIKKFLCPITKKDVSNFIHNNFRTLEA